MLKFMVSFNLLDPDPYIIYGSGSRRANNSQIQIRNTAQQYCLTIFLSIKNFNIYRYRYLDFTSLCYVRYLIPYLPPEVDAKLSHRNIYRYTLKVHWHEMVIVFEFKFFTLNHLVLFKNRFWAKKNFIFIFLLEVRIIQHIISIRMVHKFIHAR